jgi:hypothetical protein
LILRATPERTGDDFLDAAPGTEDAATLHRYFRLMRFWGTDVVFTTPIASLADLERVTADIATKTRNARGAFYREVK